MDSLLVVKTKTATSQDGLPKNFLNRFGEHVTGICSGFDRVRFRATLRPLFCPNGPEVYLNYCKVLIKNFKGFAQGISDRVKKLAHETFQQAGRPNIYLPSPQLSKEALIQDLVAKDQIKQGPIALLSCVEPCLAFRVRGDRQTKTLRLVMESAKCTHLYHYYQHPEIGLMHIRVQTWFPFRVGRPFRARRLASLHPGLKPLGYSVRPLRGHRQMSKLQAGASAPVTDDSQSEPFRGAVGSPHPLSTRVACPNRVRVKSAKHLRGCLSLK